MQRMRQWCLSFVIGSVLFTLPLMPLSGYAQDGKKTYDLKPVTRERLLKGTDDPSAWLMYGGNYESWRFSPLKDINRQNVKNLSVAWMFQTGIPGRYPVSHRFVQSCLRARRDNRGAAVEVRSPPAG
jgi:alcohol dehydrogenase (cytochrome c)